MSTKTIVVLGAAYGGPRAAQILAAGLPWGWRVLLIDRNSHTNHVYVFPRLTVLPGHEHKAFIPNTNVFLNDGVPVPHRRLQATVVSFTRRTLKLSKAFPEYGVPSQTVPYDYMIYALGSHMPMPLNVWGTDLSDKHSFPKPVLDPPRTEYRGMKPEGIAWLQDRQKEINEATDVLVVGGGALGIQYATDIATIYPKKKVTLLHSRKRLLPKFDYRMHKEVLDALNAYQNITVILGERLDLQSLGHESRKPGRRVVKTLSGLEITCDLLLQCTGQIPNTGFLEKLDPETINPRNSLARVLRTLQLSTVASDWETTPAKESSISPVEEKLVKTPYGHIFVVGDAADAFGAIAAGHNAYYQGEVAARNIIRLVKRAEGIADEPLELYIPGRPAIKLSLGLGTSVFQSQDAVGRLEDEPEDLHADKMWPLFGINVTSDGQMYL